MFQQNGFRPEKTPPSGKIYWNLPEKNRYDIPDEVNVGGLRMLNRFIKSF